MSAIIKACLVGNSLKNTGKECDTAMVADAMLIAVPKSLKFTLDDLEDPIAWITPLLHAAKGQRVYPFFGEQAPIRTITNGAESDVLVTLDDGLQIFLRYGVYNTTYETTSGGICYADSLQGLNKSGYNIIKIDQQGQMLVRKNRDATDTRSGLITDFMYSPSPIMPDFKTTPYKNRFMVSFSPAEFVQNGEILSGAESLLALMGLIESDITKGTSTQTTTHLFIGVKTECAETDLVALFGAALAVVANFVVTNKATGVVVSITAAAIVSGQIQLTGTFISGQTYTVKGAAPSVWLGNNVQGYDAEDGGVDILIP